MDLAGPDHGQLGTITGDPLSHRIFAIRTSFTTDPGGNLLGKNEVLTINNQTGAFSVSLPIDQPAVGQITFDMSTKALYILSFNGVFTVDPITGAATRIASLGTLSLDIQSMAVAPGAHTIYVNNEVLGHGGPGTDQILTVDTRTGLVSASHELAQPVRMIIYDASVAGLFGATECCPQQLVRIDPATGSEASVVAINNNPNAYLAFAMALDPASHTVFMDVVTFLTTQDHIVSVNDQTGVTTVSPAINDIVWSQYFEPVVLITPAVTGMSPRFGIAECGGTHVRIRGANFTGATSVHFGSKAAESFRVRSPGVIVAIAPAEPAGTVDVTVTTPNGTSPKSSADRFTYRPQNGDRHGAGEHRFDGEEGGGC